MEEQTSSTGPSGSETVQNLDVDTPPATPRVATQETQSDDAETKGKFPSNQSPPHKKLKATPMKTPRPIEANGIPKTPRAYVSGENVESSQQVGGDTTHLVSTPGSTLRRRSSVSSSSLSDLSHSSRFEGSFSPRTRYVPDVPPAPPSTPASELKATISSSHLAGMPTPLPYAAAVKNAAHLERQQHLAEGAATPAPTKPVSNKTSSAAAAAAAPDQPAKSNRLADDFSQWAVGERYKMIRMLGRGSYGEVGQAVDLFRDNATVAIKRIQSPFDQEVDAVRLFREIHILRRLKGHDCVVDLLDVIQPPSEDLNDFNDLYLVFEYVDTDLYKLIMSPQYLTTEHIQTFLYQMLIGLKYLHSASVIHRDLKPANILLNEDCSLKLCDFGLARIVNVENMRSASTKEHDVPGRDTTTPDFGRIKRAPLTRQLTKHVVTRWYRAPELILIQPYTSAVDIWSLGCILAELLSMQEANVPGYQDRTPLFPGGTCYPLSGESGQADERLDQLSMIFGVIGTPSQEDIAAIGKANEYIKTLGKVQPKKGLKERFPAADPAALDLLDKMLKFNPERRCTADEALDHDFLRSVRRKDMEQIADQPLIAPSFLSAVKIDLNTLKQKTYEETMWYRTQSSNPQKS